jgi:EAL domain-containing protein (putative c-di-GMP-specific phosphodiesterase class I)
VADTNHKKPAVRVVVIDDHEMILQSVVRLLAADTRIEVVGTALTAAEGIEVASGANPDVVVIDFHLPDMDAPEAIRLIHAIHPAIKVVTISGSDRPGSFYDALRAGSMAWVRKTRAIQELRVAIMTVASGEPYVNEEMEVQPDLDQLVVYYQPILALSDGRVVGFEALVRWQHPERGLLFPDSFLPSAIDSGFIEEIDLWVLQESTRQLRTWQEEFPTTEPLFVSVNMSKGTLAKSNIRETILNATNQAGIKATDLVIEVKESILVENPDETIQLLTELNDVGVRLALDEFGASFSTISYIHQVPFDCVKIGRSFTRDLPASTGTLWLIEGIRKVTETMNTMCIAAGIENPDQLNSLRESGVEFGQGFLFSAAVKSVACRELLAQHSLMSSLTSDLNANAVGQPD